MSKTARMMFVAFVIIFDVALVLGHTLIIYNGPETTIFGYMIYGMSFFFVIWFSYQGNKLIKILWEFLKLRKAKRNFLKACDNDLGIQIRSFNEYEKFADIALIMDNVMLYIDHIDEWPQNDQFYDPDTPDIMPVAGVYFKQLEDKIEFFMHLS